MTQQAPIIPPEVANHVLAHFGRGGYEAGSFTQHLLRAFCTADLKNFHRLFRAYPEYGAAVTAAQNDTDGIDRLQHIARGGEAA